MKKRASNKLKCLCCGGQVPKSDMKMTLGRQVWVWGRTKKLELEDLAYGKYQWACDSCHHSGKAILGNPQKQLYCEYDPYLSIFDTKKKCESCGIDYIFSKSEQQYWYEGLCFWVQSKPNNCPMCRKEIRHEKQLNSELSKLLADKEKLTVSDMERLADIYEEIQKPEKVLYYRKKKKKKKRKTVAIKSNQCTTSLKK